MDKEHINQNIDDIEDASFKDLRQRKKELIKEKKEINSKRTSNATKYIMTSITAMLILGGFIVVLLFRTNAIIDDDVETNSGYIRNYTTVSTVITQAEASGGDTESKPTPNPDPGHDPNLDDGMAQSALNFYNKCNLQQGTPTGMQIDGVDIYDGLPWDNTNAYTLNIDNCYKYVDRYLDGSHASSIAIDNKVGSVANIDGVNALPMAGLPILSFLDIDDAGAVPAWGQSTRPRKMCGILEDVSGNTFYIPLTCNVNGGDAKGHAWPGGLFQTFLGPTDKQTVNAWQFNSDGGTIKGNIIGTTISDLGTIKTGYATVTYGNNPVAIEINLETKEAYKNAIEGTYKLSFKGFISWRP